MTITIIEYTDGVETGRADTPDYGEAGLWVRAQVGKLNLTLHDDMETYSTPDGKVVRFALSQESGAALLRDALMTEEVDGDKNKLNA